MGGIVKGLFGGSDQKSTSTQSSMQESGNNAFGYLKEALGGNVGAGSSAMAQMMNALGLGDNAAGAAGVNAFANSAGHNFALDSGSKAITNNAAAKGMLNSGATGKALTAFGQNLGQQTFNNYLTQLGALMQGGQQAASIISGAGQYSRGTSTGQSSSKGSSSNGIIPALFG